MLYPIVVYPKTGYTIIVMKRRSKPKIFFSSFRLAAGGLGGAAQKNERKIFGFAARDHRERVRGAQRESPRAPRVRVGFASPRTQSVRQLFFSKWVRAKVSISPPYETSRALGADEPREKFCLVDPAGFEPAAFRVQSGRSSQLSYGPFFLTIREFITEN